MHLRSAIPWSMVALRFILGPIAALVALRVVHPQLWLGLIVAAGFLSDVYDGILARKWGTATARLRIADSAVDIVFYLGVLSALIVRHGDELHARLGLLIAVLAFEAARLVFDFARYGRMSSYHTYTAKAWGVLLATSTITLLCFDRFAWLLTVTLIWGILCDTEGLLITALLPQWAHDVKSLPRALVLRRQMLAACAEDNAPVS